MGLLYRFFVGLYGRMIHLAAWVNPKAKKWVVGRQNWRKRYREELIPHRGAIWMHAASLGEFEQGRPLIDALRKSHPNTPIVISFFSPSGFEAKAPHQLADAVFYLPIDSPRNARDLLEILQPKIAIWVKYEFWISHLQAIKKAGVPLVLISGVFRPTQPFFLPWGAWFSRQLHLFDHIFVQDEGSAALLQRIGVSSEVCGDTRFDRVAAIAENAPNIENIERFIGDRTCIIAGSSWPEEERLLAEFRAQHPGAKHCFIIVPHEVNESHLVKIEKLFGSELTRFSAYRPDAPATSNVLVIDRIGLLSTLYRYATIAVVGGGFGKGIHNTAEAAIYGIPVVFGPNYKKFREARDLIALGGAFTVSSQAEFTSILAKLIEEQEFRAASGRQAATYIKRGTGATQTILSKIGPYLKA